MLPRHDEPRVIECDRACEDVCEVLPLAVREILRHVARDALVTLGMTSQDGLRAVLELVCLFVDPIVPRRVAMPVKVTGVRNQSRPTRQAGLARYDPLGVSERPFAGLPRARPCELRAGAQQRVGIADVECSE